jgi:hypothetical protein
MPDVFTWLLDHDSELVFSGKQPKNVRLPDEIAGHPHVEGVVLPLRRTDPDKSVRAFRRLCDLAWSFEPALGAGLWTRKRAAFRALSVLSHPEPEALARRVHEVVFPAEVADALNATFARIEAILPPEPALEEAIRRVDADAIFLLTRCSRDGPERDVIKVGRRLGIPSVMLVWSWDNLSSKAVLNEHPDRLLVWNEVQAAEAVELHGIPSERISVVGAANFDRFFAQIDAETREASVGEGEAATILYLGSSSNVVPDEPTVFARWIAALRSSDDQRLREARVVVRPHPGGGTKVFSSWEPPDDRVLLFRPQTKVPEGLALALAEADAVVALNTSAEIEAAIAGCPVLTFRAGHDAPGQAGSAHFRYLLEASGGFVIDAPDLEEHLRQLSAVLRQGYDRAAMARAIQRFVRPAGISLPVAPLVASAVLEIMAQGKRPPPEPVRRYYVPRRG